MPAFHAAGGPPAKPASRDHALAHELNAQPVSLQSPILFGSAGVMSLPPTWDLFGEDHLPHRLQLLAKMIDRETGRQLQREFSMSLAEWRVLAFVCAAGASSAADVAAGSEIDRAEVSRATARLLADGLMDRTADPKHRKRLILSPTERGADVYTLVRDRRREYFHQILRDVPAATREALNTALRSIALRVQQVATKG